jgi:hypothetical protein
MNRKQRREQARLGMVDLRTITWHQQMTDAECETMLANRLMMNLLQTGHPFHHLTANGVIVEPDPTQEYYLSRLSPEKQEAIHTGWQTRVKPDAPKAIPVNRKYYGHDPFGLFEDSRGIGISHRMVELTWKQG